MTTYYKFLNDDNTGQYSNFDYTPYLPKGRVKGKWLPMVGELVMCKSGYHVCERKDIFEWANEKMFLVETRGESKDGEDKTVFQQIRLVEQVKGWNEKNLRLSAADIVSTISLPIWKKYYPDDNTLEGVIDIVRRYAAGKATDKELSAAQSAAGSAAG